MSIEPRVEPSVYYIGPTATNSALTMYLRGLTLLCGIICVSVLCACESDPPPDMPNMTPMGGSVSEPEACMIGFIREGEACVIDVELDRDLDGVPDVVDNCPDVANPPQSDCDLDGIGDLCDDERACGANLSGYVRLFQQGMTDSTPLRYGSLELEGVPSLSTTDEFGQYSLRHLSAGEYTLLIYPDPSEETDELTPPTSTYSEDNRPNLKFYEGKIRGGYFYF
jgi:hypothetical protein